MVYPVFEVNSIKNRCSADIDKFIKDPTLTEFAVLLNDFNKPELNDTFTDKEDMTAIINGIIAKFDEILKDGNKFENFNYPHDIKKYTQEVQCKLWILRTILFYQLLIFATKMMLDKTLFALVYSNTTPVRTYKPIKETELKNYKMGIFGSLTPSSDIDVGIQYSGNDLTIVGLSYIVSIVEDVFIIFLNKSSLEMDIETYADMMTLPNNDESFPDLFYLDTTKFVEDDLKQMLPYAYASIIRNYITSEPGNDVAITSVNDSATQTDIAEKIGSNFKSINGYLKEGEEWTEANHMVTEYMNGVKNDAAAKTHTIREKYYELVNVAETKLMKIREAIPNIDKTQLLEMMKLIGHALIFRAESYTCAPTVIHVVRIIQAGVQTPNAVKYPTTFPKCLDDEESVTVYPKCNIGKFGYILSMLEQYGYLLRFYNTYCSVEHFNNESCTKKLTKYGSRYKNAEEEMNKLPVTGGKHKIRVSIRKSRKYKRSSKSRKNKRSRKNHKK
jgi:hypothetical protein